MARSPNSVSRAAIGVLVKLAAIIFGFQINTKGRIKTCQKRER